MLSFQASKQSIWWLSACYAKSWQENRNRPSYLGAYKRYSHTTPNVKTHAAGEYTNTYGGRFDGETGENTTLETERTRPGLQSRCTSSAFPEWVEWSAADKTNTKKASTRSNQSPTVTTTLQNLSRMYRACRAAHRQDATNAEPYRFVLCAEVILNDPMSTNMMKLDCCY